MTSSEPRRWRPGLDYGAHGAGYASHRQPDPCIAARVHGALRDAQTVINVGAGAGSYEPTDRHVIAIEPSAAMRSQRAPGLAPAIDARAQELPLDDGAVDAAMAILTVHHWEDRLAGLRELRRVARGPVVVLTFDAQALERFWLLSDYGPELLEDERRRFPDIRDIVAGLGEARVEEIPVPRDCRDGFGEAYYARPEAFLDAAVRNAQSAWPRLPTGVEERIVAQIARDLASGAWDERYGQLRDMPEWHGAVRMVVSDR